MENKKPPTIAEYVGIARSTALYPTEYRLTYPALGLADEAAELIDALFPQSGTKVAPMTINVIGEMGDVLWYTVNTALDIKIPVEGLVELATNGLHCETFEDLCFQRLRPRDRRSPYMKLATYSGRVAGVAKKVIRDTNGAIPTAKRLVVVDSLTNILTSLCEICDRFGVCLSDVAQYNAEKLTSRKERGKLQGDGDDR